MRKRAKGETLRTRNENSKRLYVLSARDADRSLRSRLKDVIPLQVDDAVIHGQEDDGEMRDDDEMDYKP